MANTYRPTYRKEKPEKSPADRLPDTAPQPAWRRQPRGPDGRWVQVLPVFMSEPSRDEPAADSTQADQDYPGPMMAAGPITLLRPFVHPLDADREGEVILEVVPFVEKVTPEVPLDRTNTALIKLQRDDYETKRNRLLYPVFITILFLWACGIVLTAWYEKSGG